MKYPVVQFGLETEIGIARDDAEELDVVAESIALVRSATVPGILMRWDYESEDPHADVRGFHVDSLRQDVDEANYVEQDSQRELSYAEIKSDLVFGNGARFYNDHAHPEYCTPECTRLEELIIHDRAGERILMACAEKLSSERGTTVRLYKNNTDFFGHSYGCHENYLIPRSLPWGQLVQNIQTFLVTRQIFAGAGKFGVEEEDRYLGNGFQLSQRSDFFSELQSVDTMQRRPIINTRDEPHANPHIYRRFHVILGDANMSPFATRLKVGSTALVLEALAQDPGAQLPQLAAPLEALTSISRDTTHQWEVLLEDQRTWKSVDLQREYLQWVKERCDLNAPDRAQLVRDWEEVLDDLEAEPLRCADRLDWVAKWQLIHSFRESQQINEEDPWIRSLDLEYHRLDPAEGLYYGLEQGGQMRHIPDDTAVRDAMVQPPSTSRAMIRGLCVQKFASSILSAQWDHVTLRGKQGVIKISLMDLFAPDQILRYAEAIKMAESPDDLRFLSKT